MFRSRKSSPWSRFSVPRWNDKGAGHCRPLVNRINGVCISCVLISKWCFSSQLPKPFNPFPKPPKDVPKASPETSPKHVPKNFPGISKHRRVFRGVVDNDTCYCVWFCWSLKSQGLWKDLATFDREIRFSTPKCMYYQPQMLIKHSIVRARSSIPDIWRPPQGRY